ncbi:hypothetical protein FRX31_023376 [Thalictrum thalictroides]|uniref:Uncharacterized protein n=1 Tax=Thalictrum thalictroides TaxID=46969 RepID=A0A7J6VR25_THATH|nr:hypothetical protein FRX31_023376 [Thalictrum thalictroides]
MQSKSRKEVNQARESIQLEKIKDLQFSNSPNMRYEAKGKKQNSTNNKNTSKLEGNMENTSIDGTQCKELVMNNVEDTLEELEVAFKKKWIQSRSRTEIDLTRVKEADEEKWGRTLVGKLQTKRWFDVDDVKKELIRNWGFRSKFEFAMLAEEFKECLRKFGRELSRDESRKVMNFSYFQKAKSYKFGAGIQTRHISAVDTENEIDFEDRKFTEWKEEKQDEEERKKKELTQLTNSQKSLTTEGTLEISKENGFISSGAASKPGQEETEASMGGFKCGINAVEDAHQVENMEGNQEMNIGEIETGRTKPKEGELSEVRSMEISPLLKEKIKEIQVQSVTMMDISQGSEPKGDQGNKNSMANPEGPSCRRVLFQEPTAALEFGSPSLNLALSETLQTLQSDPAHQLCFVTQLYSQSPHKDQNPLSLPITVAEKSKSTSYLANTTCLADQEHSETNLGNLTEPVSLVSNEPEAFSMISKPLFKVNREIGIVAKSKKRDRVGELGEEEEEGLRKKLKMVMVFSCDAERGKLEMKEEDKALVTQERIDEVVRIMKLYKNGGSPSKDEKKFLKDETNWLQEKNFNFGLGVLADGIYFRKECDESYAKYLITYGIPEEEEDMKSEAQRGEGDITTAQSSTESGISTGRTIKKRKTTKMGKKGDAVVPKKPPVSRC